MEHIKQMISIVNSEVDKYNPLKVEDFNRVKKIVIDLTSMPDKLATSIAIDYELYRTNVLGYDLMITRIYNLLQPFSK